MTKACTLDMLGAGGKFLAQRKILITQRSFFKAVEKATDITSISKLHSFKKQQNCQGWMNNLNIFPDFELTTDFGQVIIT